MSTDRDGTISVLRACLLSTKGGVSLRTLNKDYEFLVGTPIPHRSLGFNKIEDFLRSVSDIVVKYGGNGEVLVSAIPSEESAHIASLVNRQKTSQKKRTAVPSFGRKRPTYQFRHPGTTSRYGPPHKDKFSITINNNAHNKSRSVSFNSNKPISNTEVTIQKHKFEFPPRFQKAKKDSNDFQNSAQPIVSEEGVANGINSICDLSLNLKNSSNENNIEELDVYDSYQSGLGQKSKKSIMSPYSPRYAIEAGRAQTEAQAVNELKHKYTNENQESDVQQEVTDMIEYNMDVAPWNRVKPGLERSEKFTCKLLRYCTAKGWPEPSYKFLERRPKNSPLIYGCQVKVGLCEQYFSSYPDESVIQEEAKELAAKKAYRELTEINTDEPDNILPVTADISQIELRLFEICSKNDAGIWANTIPAQYTSIYKEHLPSDWLKIASTFSKLLLNTVCMDKVIICANKQQEMQNTILNDVNVAATPQMHSNIHSQAIPPLKDYWDVFVTYVESTDEFYVRIIGPEYSEKYESLSHEMELYYTKELNKFEAPPSNLHIEGYFAARIIDEDSKTDSWHRVYVQDINWEAKTVEAWLVDNGECLVISLKQIFHLAERFTVLPRQAVTCSLAGLEHPFDDESLINFMNDLLLGKVLVAQVIHRDSIIENAHSLVLYDTSSEEDININEYLINRTVLNSEPQLPNQEGIIEVYVSHIMEEGQLYVQVRNNAFNHLEKLIANLSSDLITKHCVTSSSNISCDKIYLAKSKKGDWYRATITRIPPGNQVEVKFVDYGNTELLNIYNICNLEAISNVLSRISHQALPVLLHGVDIGEQEYVHMKKLLTSNEPVLLKILVTGAIPKVELFKRASEPEGGGALISINNSIAFESIQSAQKRPPVRRSKSVSRIVTSSVLSSKSENATRIVPPSVLQTKSDNSNTVYISLRPPVIPDINSGFFDVLVTTAANPSNFIVQPLEDINRLQELSNDMLTFYSVEKTDKWIPQNFTVGGLYAALFVSNNQWYRVTLKQRHDECATVHSCDFGDYEMIPTSNLRFLASQFTKLPYQGIKAKLTGVEPIHTDWLVEDCIRFQELVVDKQLVSIVMEKGPDLINPSETVLALKLIDTNTEEDVIVADVLVKEKRGKIC